VFPSPGGLPVLLTILGNPKAINENLGALDAGYRIQLHSNMSLDFAGFYNRYDDLQTSEPGIPFLEFNPLPPHLNVPTIIANNMFGEAHGLEAAVKWKATNRWTLSSGYAFERIHLHKTSPSRDTASVPAVEGSSPHVQAQLGSNLALLRSLEWNTSVYFVGRVLAEQVPSYTRLDTGITWRASEHLAISLVGQNLLKDHHVESIGTSAAASLIKRSAYAKFTWQF
jgi:iron complex outermembrane receptor protein